jgi:hypothetical protein
MTNRHKPKGFGTSKKNEKLNFIEVEVTATSNYGELSSFKYLTPEYEFESLSENQKTDKTNDLFCAYRLTKELVEGFDFSHILTQWRPLVEDMLPQVVGLQVGPEITELLLKKVSDSLQKFEEDGTEEQEFFHKYGFFLFEINIQDESTFVIEDLSEESLSIVIKNHISSTKKFFQENPKIVDSTLENMLFNCLLRGIQDLINQSGRDAVRLDTYDELLDILTERYLTDPSWLSHSNKQSLLMSGFYIASQNIEAIKKELSTLEQFAKFLELDSFIVQKPKPFSAQRTSFVSNHPVLASAISTLIASEALQKDNNGHGFFESKFPNQLVIRTYISAYQPSSGNPNLLAFEQAKQVAEKFNTSVASIHLVFAAHAQSLSRPWEGKFRVNCDELIELLEIGSKRRGHSLPKLRAEIYQMVMTLQQIMVQAVRVEDDRSRMMIQPTPLWNILPEVEMQIGSTNDFNLVESVGFVISPGAWLDYCDEVKNSSFSLDLFKLRQDSLAKKIALVVSITGTTSWNVEDLLEKAYGLFQFPNRVANSSRLRNQKTLFVNALRKLTEILRWQCEFDPSGNWLYSTVKILKPKELDRFSKRLELSSKEMVSPVNDASIIKNLLYHLGSKAERDFTQSDLAAKVGMRQATISDVFTGKRQMGPMFRKKINAFIDTLALSDEEKKWILGQSDTPIRSSANKLLPR